MNWNPNEKVIRWLKLAEHWSRQTGCPAALILAVIQQESGGNPKAVRYEAGYEQRYSNRCNEIARSAHLKTSEVATSYGLMQLMFPVAWGYGARSTMELKIPDTAIRYGAAHLAMLYKKNGCDVKKTAGAYNGAGANSKYARDVAILYEKYKKEV